MKLIKITFLLFGLSFAPGLNKDTEEAAIIAIQKEISERQVKLRIANLGPEFNYAPHISYNLDFCINQVEYHFSVRNTDENAQQIKSLVGDSFHIEDLLIDDLLGENLLAGRNLHIACIGQKNRVTSIRLQKFNPIPGFDPAILFCQLSTFNEKILELLQVEYSSEPSYKCFGREANQVYSKLFKETVDQAECDGISLSM